MQQKNEKNLFFLFESKSHSTNHQVIIIVFLMYGITEMDYQKHIRLQSPMVFIQYLIYNNI